MSEEQLIRWCAPTLASIKTGSMFSGDFASRDDMLASLRSLNQRLSGKGLRILPLRLGEKRCLIYLYRPQQLSHDLDNAHARQLLADCGYAGLSPDHCVCQLMDRIRSGGDFPHEVGLFLGYPPEDVDGFIHRHSACRYVGRWKVYSDIAAAKRTFDRFDRCTRVYLSRYHRGDALEALAIPTHTKTGLHHHG